jgi:class II lanthipeptide synthase
MRSCFRNATHTGGASGCNLLSEDISACFLSRPFAHKNVQVSFSDEEFATLVEAAADFSDYRSGQYFAKRESGPPSEPASALRLRDSSSLPPWAHDLRQMIGALAGFDFAAKQSPPLVTLCQVGVRFGWQELERRIDLRLLALISPRARNRLKRGLQQILERTTRPCLELEQASYNLALAAIGLPEITTDQKLAERKFLGAKPGERLLSLFKKFPALSALWLQLISQWRDQVIELLLRLTADRTALSREFLGGQPVGPIVDLRCGLSDPHHEGRTVTLLEFAAGSIIYKPRPGDGEWEWFSLLQEMNARSFRPKLRAARVLRRKGYCWMERVEASSCPDKLAAKRFYERMGGIIGVAYLLRAVDCHRHNLLAAGEHPILVDAETLWHFASETEGQTPLDRLNRTGFFPGSNRRGLQFRSSVLGGAATGQHVPKIRGKAISAAQYQRAIVEGFCRAWRCIFATKSRRVAFARRLRRIESRERRWIYRPTETYARIARASIQPAAARSGIERELLIARLCSRKTVPETVIHAEIAALKRLDIPYLTATIKDRSPPEQVFVPTEVIEALRRALDS